MRAIFGLIFNRWVFGVLGLIALSLLIWYGGPLISVAGKAPLESETVRLVVIALILLWFLLRMVWKLAQAQRQNAQLTEGLLKQAPTPARPQEQAGAAQVETLRQRFEEAVVVL